MLICYKEIDAHQKRVAPDGGSIAAEQARYGARIGHIIDLSAAPNPPEKVISLSIIFFLLHLLISFLFKGGGKCNKEPWKLYLHYSLRS